MACCTIPPTQKRGLEFDLPRSKRRKCGTMYTLQPTLSPNSTQAIIIDGKAKKINPFHLQTTTNNINDNEKLMERIRNEAKRYYKRKQLSIKPPTSNESPLSSPTTIIKSDNLLNNDIPLFSIEQVSQICEKMLKEREDYLKEQYNVILSQKLSEQYDAFVKFTHEQIQKRFESSNFSYVS
jgi:hypothetical protein